MESRRLIVSVDGKVTVIATTTAIAAPNQTAQQTIKIETKSQKGSSQASGSVSARIEP